MDELTRNAIIRRRIAGVSIRGIARELGISRGAVSRAIAAVERAREEGADASSPRRPRRASMLDAYGPVMQELLERFPQITATRMLEELQARGFTGAYTIVCERLRLLRPRPIEPVVRFETKPGRQAQMDYSPYTIDFTREGRRTVHAFSYVLGYSRRQYLRFVERQDFATTVREHVRAFAHFGGVAHECLYDNMKVVVLRWIDDEPVYNPRFLAFATHYGFRPHACLPRRAQTKGKVERPFQYIEGNLLNGREFTGLEHLNEVAAWWTDQRADVRRLRELQARPIDRFADEVPELLPLPRKDAPTDEVCYRTVDTSGFIQHDHNFYSVPPGHIGERRVVRIGEAELAVLGRDLEVVARHRLLPREVRGQRQRLPEHSPERHRRAHDEDLRARFEELGHDALAYFDGLLGERRYGRHQARKILGLLTSYNREDLAAALKRALRYRAFGLSYIERILVAQARPRPVSDTLAEQVRASVSTSLDADAIEPRSGDDYQHLLGEEDDDGDTSTQTEDHPQGPLS